MLRGNVLEWDYVLRGIKMGLCIKKDLINEVVGKSMFNKNC